MQVADLADVFLRDEWQEVGEGICSTSGHHLIGDKGLFTFGSTISDEPLIALGLNLHIVSREGDLFLADGFDHSFGQSFQTSYGREYLLGG